MRISKFMLPAIAVAGALALAGCGGGSDSSETEPPGTTPPATTPPASGPASLDLPNNLTINGLNTAREPEVYTIQPGQRRDILSVQANRGAVRFTCPAEGAACVITVPVDGNAGSVTYTGGTPVITEVGDPATAAPAAATPQPTASADPLSDEVLLQAVAAVGSEGTVWGTAAEAGLADATAQDSPHRLRPLEGKNIDLWIAAPDTPAASGDYIFYGHWAEVDQKVTDERTNRGVVWGGSMPYGKNPDGSFRNVDSDTNADTNAETIQYATGAADALIYHSTNGKTWTATTANAALTANFKTGYINGTIDTTGLSTGRANGTNLTADANGDITLKDAMIKSAGTFSGTAEFSAAGVSNQSGSWNGGFFGDPVTGGLTQAHQRPSNVAGEFRVSRPAIGSGATARQSQLHVRGAFGGADEGS